MSQKERDDDRWYPGKHAKRALVNFKQRRELVEAKKAKGEWQPPTNPLAPFNIMLKEKRPLGVRAAGGAAPAVGQLFVSVLGGTFRTKRAYLILELDGNEQRTETATCDAPSWNDDFAFPVHDPSSDLRIFVFDDEKAANERPVGRVIIPLARLCRGLLLRTPSAPRRLLLQVSPVCTQHAKATHARFDEATPRVPGSGMVRPSKELGRLEIVVQLKLDVPGASVLGMLAAYARAPPPGEIEREASADDAAAGGEAEPAPKVQPKVLRLNTYRLRRYFGAPHLLRAPAVFALPLVLAAVCFALPLWTVPWVVVGLAAANGALDHARRAERTAGMVFWEEEVGESDMPTGLKKLKMVAGLLAKLQGGLGKAAAALERNKNTLNFADGSVTAVAFALLSLVAAACSAVLYLVPPQAIVFAVATLALIPSMAKAASGGGGGVDAAAAAAAADDDDGPVTPRKAAPAAPAADAAAKPGLAQMVKNVLSRAPDSSDLAHRHFCDLMVLSDQDFGDAVAAEPESKEGYERLKD